MTPGEVERTYEEIKRHLGSAQRHQQAEARRQMRKEAETAAVLFQRVRAEAGDPMGMLDALQKVLKSFGYSEEECDALLSPPHSPTSMKKAKQSKKGDKEKKDVKAVPYVQPQYHKPSKLLPGFPNAVPVKKKGGRKRWVDKKAKRIYEWDYQHGHVEGWDSNGKDHKGAFNPNDGTQVKPSDPTKKPITPEIVTPMKKKENYALAWYSIEDKTLVDEVPLKLSPDQVRKWFYLAEDDPAIYCYDVTASQRKHLMKLLEVEIDLNEYDYQLEGRAEDE